MSRLDGAEGLASTGAGGGYTADMRSPEEAIRDILTQVEPSGHVEDVRLLDALGRVLAEDVASDVDLPPFQKSAMDGFAVHSADFAVGADEGSLLSTVGESRAGAPFSGSVPLGSCVAIYTGAEVPADCDAVVMVEKSVAEGSGIRLHDAPGQGQNICNRGEDLARGARVFPRGRRISSTDLSVLAAVGAQPVRVFRRPRVAVLTTGDELVEADQSPGAGQIREGNTLHLAALARLAGAEVLEVGIVRDDPEELRARFGHALDTCDAVITTGGVSMGKYDLVAEAFQELGVEEVFHKVAIKPGKPIWFGMRGTTPVFALPGNPVSCLLDHEVFVRPALGKLGGLDPERWHAPLHRGRWEGGPVRPNPRQQNLPVTLDQDELGVTLLRPLAWRSSADIVGLSAAQGMAIVPPGEAPGPGALLDWRALDER